MIYNINEELTNLLDKKDKVDLIVNDIKSMMEEYERNIKSLKDELIVSRDEYDSIKNSFVRIKLGDLIDEISWLSGVNRNKIMMSIKFNKIFLNLDEAASFVQNICSNNDSYVVSNTRFYLSSNLFKEDKDSVPFSYFLFLSFDFNEIQCDGKRLIEHCSFSPESISNGQVNLTVSTNLNVDDIMCNIPFSGLDSKDNSSWYPADLFTQAVINVSSREYDSKVDKIRTRIK